MLIDKEEKIQLFRMRFIIFYSIGGKTSAKQYRKMLKITVGLLLAVNKQKQIFASQEVKL